MQSMLGISQAALQEWRSRGIGPAFVKLGKAVYYRRDDVVKWIDENVFTSTTARAA